MSVFSDIKLAFMTESLNPFRPIIQAHIDIDASITGNMDRGYTINVVGLPKEEQGQGTGTRFMQDIVRLADHLNVRLMLTPSADFGGSVSRLKTFYKRFGFVENTGRNKDFSISEAMYREPQ